MIRIEVSKSDIEKINKALDNSEKNSNKALKKAINDTAKKALLLIARAAGKEYVGKFKVGTLKENMVLKKASVGSLEASINAEGGANDLIDFKVSGKAGKVIKAKVLRSSKLEKLIKGDIKAFITTFSSGHTAVVQRDSGSMIAARRNKSGRITKHNQRLKSLYSVSIPSMLGGEHGFLKVEGEVNTLLQENLSKEVAKLLEAKGAS